MENSEIVDALSGVWYLATVEDDQPHVRPFDKATEINGEIYVGTNRIKKVFAQMVENPKVEVYALNEFGSCRFTAEAYGETDAKITREAFSKMGKPMDENSVAIKFEKIRKA
ncbi:pyridoxamine 5'-phosphate oxidase family protein [Candidatus Saccharibacteria bacterium]|nr:pyridoxamine 5'-phosphate oxidase family protein [Candidatus Saccharibacteria bacterium]